MPPLRLVMLDSLLSWLILKNLRPFVEDTVDLGLHLRNGCLLLEDVTLSPTLLASLALPLTIKAVRIARLEILLPWRQSGSSLPLVVVVDGVRAIVGPLDECSARDRLGGWLGKRKQKRLHASSGAESPAVEAPVAGDPASTSSSWQTRTLVDALLRDLQVHLSNLVICFESAPGGVAVSATLSSLQLRAQRRQALPRLLSLCLGRGAELKEHSAEVHLELTVGIQWHPNGLGDLPPPVGAAASRPPDPDLAPPDLDLAPPDLRPPAEARARAPSAAAPAAAADSSGPPAKLGSVPPAKLGSVPLLEPWRSVADVTVRIEWPSAEAPTTAPTLHLDGSVQLEPLRVRVSASQLESLSTFARRTAQLASGSHRWSVPGATCRTAPRPASPRPVMPVGAAPYWAWWRYATGAVLGDLLEERRRQSWQWLRARVALQRAYEAAWTVHIHSISPAAAAALETALPHRQAALETAPLLDARMQAAVAVAIDAAALADEFAARASDRDSTRFTEMRRDATRDRKSVV